MAINEYYNEYFYNFIMLIQRKTTVIKEIQ